MDGEEGTIVEDESLQIIYEETFEQAQEKVQRIHDRYASDSDDADDVDDLVTKFGARTVVESSPDVRLHCPECSGEMKKNGQRELTTRRVQNYKCVECCRQKQFPTENELTTMQNPEYGSAD